MKRQQLCDTVPYFRQYQGGCQTGHEEVAGLLIDGNGTDKEKFNEEIVITNM